MSIKAKIRVRTEFDGIHQWEGAPAGPIDFLRNPHRHHFIVWVEVATGTNDDREAEFFLVKERVSSIIHHLYGFSKNSGIDAYYLGNLSCEMIGHAIITSPFLCDGLRVLSVEVSEDGENSAIVYHED